VPDVGEADTVAGEFLRVFSNVYYDVYNNGGCNLVNGGRSTDREDLLRYLAKYGYDEQQIERLSKMLVWLPRHSGRIPAEANELLDDCADFVIIEVSKKAARLHKEQTND
jgi:hypothetical protein